MATAVDRFGGLDIAFASRHARAGEVARAALYLASDDSAFLTGRRSPSTAA